MKSLRDILDKTIIGICVLLFAFMTIVGTYQILTRYVLKAPSTVSEELISYSFAWMSMFAASYIFGKRDHMRMVFFVEKYNKKTQTLIGILSEAVILLFAALVLIWGGVSITSLTMTQTTPALRISMGYVYSVIPVCGFITALYCLLNISNLLSDLKKEA